VRTPAGVERITPAPAPADPDGFLDLLCGRLDAREIAARASLPVEAVEPILARFDELGLLAAPGAPASELPAAEASPDGSPPAQPAPGRCVLIVGGGALAAALRRDLGALRGATVAAIDAPRDAEDAEFTSQLSRAELVIGCVEAPSHLGAVLVDRCGAAGVPLVLAELGDAEGSVALVRASAHPQLGCAGCALEHRADDDEFSAALAEHLRVRFPRPARFVPELPEDAATVVAKLVRLAALQALDLERGDLHLDGRMLRVDWGRSVAALVPIPRHHRCRRCHPLRARRLAEHREESAARFWRALREDAEPPLALAALRQRLEPLVAGGRGLLRQVRHYGPAERAALYRACEERGVEPRGSVIANAEHAVVTRSVYSPGGETRVVSEGLDFHDRRGAEALALMEAVERLFGLDQVDPELVARARHAEIAADALDPREFPLYAEAQYAETGFPMRRFDPREEIDWLCGVSLVKEQPVWVPRELVFAAGPSALYRANSNGAACHSTLVHALLNALYETVERDALMVVWLNRLSLPRLELAGDWTDPQGLRRELAALSLEPSYVDLETDLGIPVTLALVRDRLDPDLLLVDMVACLDPGERLAKLHKELVQFVHPRLADPDHFERAVTASGDPLAVTDFPDHLAFYQDRRRHALAAFLDASPTTRPLAFEPQAPRAGPREQLARAVASLASRGYDVIAVDCTHRLLRPLGLCVVKLLIPGLQPLHAGHRLRVLGGRRVYELARTLGHADRERTLADLNPWPHPFW
jgi:ribosomal protein S12 methylthiotransferase accessory factor